MILGLTQCKKHVDTIGDVVTDGVGISLNVKNDRSHVNLETGEVTFTNGDYIYVSDGNSYIGRLTRDNTGKFWGVIEKPQDGTEMQFYYAGNDMIYVGQTSFELDISDQSKSLPVISFGHVTYYEGVTKYSCELQNKCALVKFIMSQGTNNAVKVDGLYTKAYINFNGEFTYGEPGCITLYPDSETEKWAILLPQDDLPGLEAQVVDDNTYPMSVHVSKILANDFITDKMIIMNADFPFTANYWGSVRFAPGNLQYNGNENKWRFAIHQYDVMQPYTGEWETDGWVDLFGWGAWGSSNPLNTSTNVSDYEWHDFNVTVAGHNDWRVLEKDEWLHLLTVRNNAIDLHGSATVCNVNGLIILPDNWTLPEGCTFNPGEAGYDRNVYDEAQWIKMELAGAIFLPQTGYRMGNEIHYENWNGGEYWTSTSAGLYEAYELYLSDVIAGDNSIDVRVGAAVRLVH